MKKLAIGWILLASTILSSSAFATDFDFNNYQGILSRLNLLPPTGSGYDLTFTKVANPASAADYKFIYYTVDADNKLNPVYYNYSYTLKTVSVQAQADNSATIDNANGYYFELNRAVTNCTVYSKLSICGGPIFNSGTITNGIIGDFVGNYTSSSTSGNVSGGAIFNTSNAKIGDIKGDFIGNYAFTTGHSSGAYGGAIYNQGKIGNINGDFVGNYTKSTGGYVYGGAIINNTGVIGDITGNFIGNYISATSTNSGYALGGAIINSAGTIGVITGDFIGNYASSTSNSGTASGGALVNSGTISKIFNSSFIGNYAKSATGTAQGGAIWSGRDILIEADNALSEFTGNYVEVNGVKTSNAIYMAAASNSLTLNSINNGTITINDGIDGKIGYNIKLDGDAKSTINLNGEIKNADIISGGDVVTNVAKASLLNNNNNTLVVNSGTFNILSFDEKLDLNQADLNGGILGVGNLGLNTASFANLNFNGGTLGVDTLGVDLAAKQAGSITIDNIIGNARIEVDNIDVKTDGADVSTSIAFAKDNLLSAEIISKTTETTGPVFKYDVSYNQETDEFTFVRQDVNPEVLVPSVAAVAAVSVLSDEIYSRVLADADKVPVLATENQMVSNAWVKILGSDDSVDLKDFAGTDTRFDGIIGGIGSGRVSEGRGVTATYNAYAAYANGESKFSGEKVLQDAYYLGVGANFYKGNAFLGTTANIAMVRNRTDTIDGKDKFNAYVGGVAAKMGYNFDIAGLIIQPNLYASYTYIDANDYTTGRGARVEMNGISNIEVAPGLKVAKEVANGLGVYTKTRYVHTFNESQKAYANDFLLPEISLKPYVEYGLGVEKASGSYSGFAEVMRRDGGREGWNGLVGLKYNF